MHKTQPIDFDITIVGCGLVGATLACALQDQNIKILLIDKLPLQTNLAKNLDARALCLTNPSVKCFKMLKIWPELVLDAAEIMEVQTTKQGYCGRSSIKAKDKGLSAMGYVVNADDLNMILNQKVMRIKNITIERPQQISHLEKKGLTWEITFESQKKFTTSLLVAADGADSLLRKHQGIGIKVVDHQQTAFVSNVECQQFHQYVAYERFTRNGSIAILPFGQKMHQVKCVWVVPNTEVERINALSETDYLNHIQECFGHRLGRFRQSSKRVIFPLRTIAAETLYGDRLVLIGNAANTLHPIAAQGFNLGLRDAALLAEMLVSARHNNQDLGAYDLLRGYADKRKEDHQSIRQLSMRLAEPSIWQWFGITATEWLPPFKHFITQWGLGNLYGLPKLCRGVALG